MAPVNKNLPVGGKHQVCLQAILGCVLEKGIACVHMIICGKTEKINKVP